MQGEFRGDFTRDTANPAKAFLRVLMQQGRVQLDADWNEQVDILLRYVQGLGQDLMGFHGGRGQSFQIQPLDDEMEDFAIAPGRYYVDGIPCEQSGTPTDDGVQPWQYTNQPFYTVPDEAALEALQEDADNGPLLVYLDVWERHISFIEDYNPHLPGIREVALGGPDTATRSQIVWQVKVAVPQSLSEFISSLREDSADRFRGDAFPFEDESVPETPAGQIRYLNREAFRQYLQTADIELLPGQGRLRARVNPQSTESDPCRLPPKSKYRGLENRLYRVEIFRHDDEQAYFVWSRHNSAVMFPILSANSGDVVTLSLEHLGADTRYTLTEGDWVELVSDHRVLQPEPRILLKVQEVDTYERRVMLAKTAATPSFAIADFNNPQQHPYLRRWDSAGILKVELANDGWLPLEDGIEVEFVDVSPNAQPYRTGDYWLIPARTAIGNIEWPQTAQPGDGPPHPLALLPLGVTHYYAPLAILQLDNGQVSIGDCRRHLNPLWGDPS